MIRCADGTTYHGDILVGADGAYSGVRQSLYKRLEKHGKLPLSDGNELNKGFICMVGTTDPLDPAKYPGLDSETANINQIIGNNLYSWSAFSVPGNRICWNAILQLSTVKEASEHKFKNSEWGPETSEPMIKEVRDFLIPFGGTLGDLIDATPRNNISRVFLEDNLSPLDVKEAFEMYKAERYSKVKDQFSASKTNAKLIYGHKFIDQVMRYVAFNFIPQKMLDKGAYKGMDFRPQAIFLPQVPNRGTTPVLPQRVSKRYQEEQAKLGKTPKPFHVLISGAGVGGLMLAILLDKAGIDFSVYERAKSVKPLGAVMSLNAGVFPALEQLGIYEPLQKVSLPITGGFNIYNGDMTKVITLRSSVAEFVGYDHIAFARPDFYDLLIARIPPGKIHFNKKVISTEQNEKEAKITCSDGTSYSGDVLVGADGAYSAVRQGLYKQLQEEKALPPLDAQDLNKGFICMVGTTKELSLADYPGIDSKEASINQILGQGNAYSWSAFTVPGNRICWNVISQLDSLGEEEKKKLKNAEWSSESNDAMIAEVKDFLIPLGGTLGDLINATPRDIVSRVYLEDKMFETWNHGRVALIGDGLGAVTAIQDAIALANSLYDIKSQSYQGVKEALQEFRDERYSKVKDQYEASKLNAKLLYGKTWFEKLLRYAVFNFTPRSVQSKGAYKGMEYRPQAVFLPQVPNRGTAPILPQRVSERYQREMQAATVV
ncbi:hypothetical protein KI688_002380 [Linnemannia hyalina]|uniref:FAD-binding domain-containing protein n=1 Tax=Linnemannia hyalina TaxID=64524 RepID=A0A9P7XQ60_9FUNG|nr:hypothetical protein KI688_002380 [Linnemannia hyalina]